MLKGIAILMMLFLHLFSNQAFADSTTPLLWVGNTPFATIFTRACGPVGYFLVCSGYGLAYSHLHSKLSYRRQFNRVAKLYLNYWLVLSVFVGFGCVFIPQHFPGSIRMLIENFTGWNTDGYDSPAWFLLPYCVLCLTSPAIFKLVDKVGMPISLLVSFMLSFASMYVISRYIAPANAHHEWYAFIVTYFNLLFAFMLGGFICYKGPAGGLEIPQLRKRKFIVVLLLVLWFAVHCLIDSSAIGPLFLCLFMLLFVNLEISGIWRRLLLELGRKSMMMWLVHAFIYGSFFRDFIYGFRYPLLIFAALVVSAYLVSVVMMFLADKTIGRIGWLNKKS